MSFKVVVPFFGGRDDREALAYAMRMAEHPGIFLTVIKFIAPPGKRLAFGAKLVTVSLTKNRSKRETSDFDDHAKDEKQNDELTWSEFISARSKNQEAIAYEERLVESKDDVLSALKEMKKSSLVVVGRMPPVAPLVSKNDCQELGPVGSYLASSDFSSTASVLVVQQYNPTTDKKQLVIEEAGFSEIPDSPARAV